MAFARTLQTRHGLNIPSEVLYDYDFGKKFLDLFSFSTYQNESSAFTRIDIILRSFYYDNDLTPLQSKLGLERNDVTFMVDVLSKYKFGGNLPSENLLDDDPELTAYNSLEEPLCD